MLQGRTRQMADTNKKVEGTTKKVVKEKDYKDKQDKSPGPKPMGGGDSEVNESAGSRVKT